MENEKTIEQWLKEGLTPEQFENAKLCKYMCWEEYTNKLSQAVWCGFHWATMPEGFKYWQDYLHELEFWHK